MKSHLASPMSAEGYIVSPALSDFSPDEIIAPVEHDRSAGRRTVGQRFGPLLYGLAAFFGVAGPVLGASQADLQPALAQFSQDGSKLVGTLAVGLGEQGWSVALSADGNTAIVGGLADNRITGAAWVYTRSNGVWTQQSKLAGTGAVGSAGQGWSVALSDDGNTAILGGPFDNVNTGAAWVYTRSNGVWTQQRSKLAGTGAVGNAAQGISVALSDDGNTAIVGGAFDNLNTGAAWVYTRSGDVWTQLGKKLVGAGAVGNAAQGVSVGLSADGSTAIVGGPFDNLNTGAAWVYACRGAVWGTKLVGAGAVGNARQGVSVALSADGSTAIVGGVEDNSYTGAAWVYNHIGTVWTQQANKLVGTDATGSARQGHSVALSADGKTAIVGGLADNGVTGAAWIYARRGGVSTIAETELHSYRSVATPLKRCGLIRGR
jgi:antibiotic biosynthesis monooxygenase (ABM) superfamily enzyme